MANAIETKSIIELRDGRIFYVPAYQRGYRWNQEQVEDLLDDLYTFASKKGKENGEFYCLQPIIVKQIMPERLSVDIGVDNKTPVYEVIDGQQRLTTLYILLKYLIHEYARPRDVEKQLSNLFKLFFETRHGMYRYLQDIEQQNDYNNIDEKHALNAYRWIDEWFNVRETSCVTKEDIAYKFSQLLRQGKDTGEVCGSVQVIWYEISSDKDVVREFLATNNGKIKLTEAELVKALFLQKRNFQTGEKELKQMERALQWERMENTLHQDDFWYFINKDENHPSNRIECILRLAMGLSDDTETNALFRKYNKVFDMENGKELEDSINSQWQKIIDCFRTVEDWYLDPIKYNYIGYLSQSGVPIKTIYDTYSKLDDNDAQDTFIKELKDLVRKTLQGISIKGDFLNKTYKHKSEIRKILLLLNIHALNEQLSKLRIASGAETDVNSPSYKFPFDIYVNQKWDVEHIDSQTTNRLSKDEDKKAWVDGYADALTSDKNFTASYEERQWNDCIRIIKEKYEEDDENKDEIGNLTLLDAQTNRSYGNAIFPRKRERILKEIREGKYVPYCTQLVFYMNFEDNDMSNPRWNEKRKSCYGRYVCEQIKEYLN